MPVEQPLEPAREHIAYLDDLRVLATIAVVFLHTTSGYVNAWQQIPEAVWWSANFFQSSVRWAVAIFVMISGALLLAPGKDPPVGRFLARRGLRVGIPLVAWSIFYAVWRHFEFGLPLSTELLLRRFLAGNTHYHLYFLFAILGLYVWTPLLRRALARMSANSFTYVLFACWIATLFYAGNAEFSGRMADVTGSAFTKFLPFVGYYLLGHFLHSIFRISIPKIALFIALVASIAVGMLGSAILMDTYGASAPGRYMHSILSPNGLILSACVFLCVKAASTDSTNSTFRENSAYRWILQGSLGIYLVHPLVLIYAQQIHQKTGSLLPLGLDLPVMAILVLAVSTLIVTVIRMIPILRLSVGAARPRSGVSR